MNPDYFTLLEAAVASRPGVTFLGEGGKRRVYLSRNGRWVYKVPKNDAGLTDNEIESRNYNRANGHLHFEQMARCQIAPSGVLVMERVEVVFGPSSDADKDVVDALPMWTYYVDCWQVGHNRAGALVAYDWATTPNW